MVEVSGVDVMMMVVVTVTCGMVGEGSVFPAAVEWECEHCNFKLE
jgi:hypothetical protein